MARLIVDGWNIIGSRPTGWWRDRDGAALDLVDRLSALDAAVDEHITVVFDGRAPAQLADTGSIDVVFADRRGRNAADDRIVEIVDAIGKGEPVTVVTADRALRERVRALGATIASPSVVLRQLDALIGASGSSMARGGD